MLLTTFVQLATAKRPLPTHCGHSAHPNICSRGKMTPSTPPSEKRAFVERLMVLSGLALAGCGENHQETAQQQIVSYSPVELESEATPTHEKSFQLISIDGPTRFATFQLLISQSGNQCSTVTSAILKGGLAGMDEWRVKCADTGDWSIWFQRGRPPDVLSCSTTDCT